MADAMDRVRATEARMFDHSEISSLFQKPAYRKLPSDPEKNPDQGSDSCSYASPSKCVCESSKSSEIVLINDI